MSSRMCRKCRVIKPATNQYFGSNGSKVTCRECCNNSRLAKHNLWYQNHREFLQNWHSAYGRSPQGKAVTRLKRYRRFNRVPTWLTPQHLEQIRDFYAKAQQLTQQTGIVHHVDHIIPLQGQTVSGLHVPWNLQILTASENCAKSNYFEVHV